MSFEIKGLFRMNIKQPNPWTPADEKAFHELQQRRANWMGAKRNKFKATLAAALDQTTVKDSTVDALIRHAGSIREALAQFDGEQS